MTDGNGTAEPKDAAPGLTSGDSGDVSDPFQLFAEWFAEAKRREPNDPNAMALATVDEAGMPDVRMVLLKGFERGGFVFYTNLGSRKGHELVATPRAALCFHWKSLQRQVRARGPVEPVEPEEADAYFATRHRMSRIGAWASKQSQPLESRLALETAVARYAARFGVGNIPRPPHWSGFRIEPVEMEFWRESAFRLHERQRFTRDPAGGWNKVLLYP